MKIILLNDIAKVGKRYEIKEVSSGHALNFLIPQNLAIAATPDALKKVEKMKAANDTEKKVQEELMVKNMKDVDGQTITVREKVNDKGHLFAGLHREEIARELMSQKRIAIDPAAIDVAHPIKEAGEHTISVKFGGHNASFKLVIEAK